MAGFQLLLDPTAEATGTQLDVSDGAVNNGVGYRLTGLSIDDPALKTNYAASISTFGSIPGFPHGYENATVTFSNRIGGSSASNLLTKVNALREKLGKFNREGGTVRIVYPSGDTLTFDVTEAEGQGTAFDNAWVGRNRATAEVKLTCRPGGRGAEQSLGSFSETTLPVLQAVVSGIKGSLLANGRAVVTATAGDQWTVFTGVQSRYYDSGANANLFFEAEGRTPLGGAAIAAGSATPSGAGSNVMRQGTLTPVYQAMMSTHALAGTPMSHIGSFEVLARVYRPTSNTGAVSLYLEWGAGDFQTPTKNDPITFAADSYEGVWTLCKLGPVHIPKASQGTQKWEGRIVAKSTVTGDDLDVDWIGLCPTTAEGDPTCYGEWSGVQRLDTPTSFSARDEFDQTAGALTGKTAPVGGVWAGAGDADDFSVETTGKTAQRTATSDVDIDTGRFAVSGVAGFAAQATQVDFKRSANPSDGIGGGVLHQGVVARYTDINNWVTAVVRLRELVTGWAEVRVRKRVAGTVTQIDSAVVLFPAIGSLWSLRFQVDASGRWFCWLSAAGSPGTLVASGFDTALATGGALASGKPGVYDAYTGTVANTRNYDNFFAVVPTADAGCFAGQSLEIRHDRAERENAGGTTWNRVSDPRGRYLRFAPGAAEGRSNRFFLKGVRGQQVQDNVWVDPSIDGIAVDLFATPLGVAVPEP
jgi:hypothetical protein